MENRLYKTRYGAWAGSPQGSAPDFARCCEEVHDNSLGGLFHQCGRKRGYGPDEAYCKQHVPDTVAARKAENYRKHQRKWNERRAEIYGATFLRALQQIADGHNDARELAKETIAAFKRGNY